MFADRLSFLGVELDRDCESAARSSTATSRRAIRAVRVLVVHAREELFAARAARDVLRETRNHP